MSLLCGYKCHLNNNLVTSMQEELILYLDGGSLWLRSLTKDFQTLEQWLLLTKVWEMTSIHQGMITVEYTLNISLLELTE
jgi:hypothetical protein